MVNVSTILSPIVAYERFSFSSKIGEERDANQEQWRALKRARDFAARFLSFVFFLADFPANVRLLAV